MELIDDTNFLLAMVFLTCVFIMRKLRTFVHYVTITHSYGNSDASSEIKFCATVLARISVYKYKARMEYKVK